MAKREAPGAEDLTRDSLAARIYSRIRLELITGVHEPGSRLNISQLAAAYETSPTPVREAILQLVADGALELKLGHQPRVPVLSISDYVKIRETRVPLERLATELSAANISAADIEVLEGLHRDYLAAEEKREWKRVLAKNIAFHFTIYNSSKNEFLVKLIENLWLLTGPFVTNHYPNTDKMQYRVHTHDLLIDALKRRSPSEAGELVARDIREGSYLILEKLRLGAEARPSKRRKPKADSEAGA